jgi:hypothetical protein
MTDTLDIIKLALGLGAFVFIVLIGARDKRITGLLLTFPVMNGIALLTNPDPFRVAQAIYLIVIFNTFLFWGIVSTVQWMPPKPERFHPLTLLVLRVTVWTVLWILGAYVLTDHRDQFPSGIALLAIQTAIAICVGYCSWGLAPQAARQASAQSSLSAGLNWAVRIALFVAAFGVLLYTARNTLDQKWAGMASALPLPGLFGLAYLSAGNNDEQLRPIRDTVLLGPLLVIPFNWIFASIVTALPIGPLGAFHIAALLAAWTVALALVFWLVPMIERYMNRRAKQRRASAAVREC